MTKRVKKRFTSEVNVIDFNTYMPQKKHRVILTPRNRNQQEYLLKLQDAVEKELGSPAKPRVIKFAHELPLLPNGKIDVDSLK